MRRITNACRIRRLRSVPPSYLPGSVFYPENRYSMAAYLFCKMRWFSYQGIWAPGLTNSTTAAINNKYRLLAFGTLDGECCVFGVDDVTGALVQSHKMVLDPKYYPGIRVGPINNVVWTPDGCALAMTWETGGLSIFSVFGSCLMCTLGGDYGVTTEGIRITVLIDGFKPCDLHDVNHEKCVGS